MTDGEGKVFEILITSEKFSARENGLHLTTGLVKNKFCCTQRENYYPFLALRQHIWSLKVAHTCKKKWAIKSDKKLRHTGCSGHVLSLIRKRVRCSSLILLWWIIMSTLTIRCTFYIWSSSSNSMLKKSSKTCMLLLALVKTPEHFLCLNKTCYN